MKKIIIVGLVLVIIAAMAVFFVRHKKEVPINPYMVNFIVTQHFCAHRGIWCDQVFCVGEGADQRAACDQQCADIINQNPRPNCTP